MAGPTRNFGRNPDSYTSDFLVVSVGTQRASVGPAGSGSGTVIISRVGGRVGRYTSTNASFRFGVMDTDGSNEPDNVLGYTDEATTSVPYTGSGEGETIWRDLTSPIAVPENSLLAFVATAKTGILAVGMEVTSASALYERNISAGTTIPLDGYTSTPANGRNGIMALGELNVAPNRPGAITISGGVSNQQPTVKAAFSDDNETLRNGESYDRLETYRIEVWWGGTRQSNDVYTATSTERNGRYSQRQISPTIPFDTPYTIIVFHRDRLGLESVGRSYSGTIFSGAAVDTPTSPTGRVVTPANPGGITAKYTSSGSVNANAVQVRRLNTSGSPVKTSPILSRTVTPGSNTTVTWAQSTFGTMPNGTTVGVQMRARDTNGNWSEWSGPTWFTTNAIPNIPTLYHPSDGWVGSSVPNTAVTATDSDDASSDLTVTAEYYDTDTDTLIGSLTLSNIPGTTSHIVHPTSVITTYGNYGFRARATDGYETSAWSPLWGFSYAAVPTVTITAPSSPVSTSQPAITWSSTGQTHWRVRGYDGSRLVYDTGQVTGGSQLHTITSSTNWIGGELWNNGEAFEWIVSVRDSSGLWGDSAPLSLTLSYTPLDTLIIDGEAKSFDGMDGTHYIHVTNSVTTYGGNGFVAYHRRRVNIVNEMGSEIAGTEVTLPSETNAGTTSFNDYHVVANQWYRYYLWQTVEVGNDIVPSPVVSIDLMVSWNGIVLFSNADPLNSAVWLKYGAPGASWEPVVNEVLSRRNVAVRGRRAPVAIVDGHRELTANGEHTFIDDHSATASEKLAKMYRLVDWQYKSLSPDGRPHGICYREGRGGSRGLIYTTMDTERRPFHSGELVAFSYTEYTFDPYAEVDG